jgi:predicted component of viral defense system (DUF524 family)
MLGGHLPRQLWLAVSSETLDSPENRFVAGLLDRVEDATRRIQATGWLWEDASDRQRSALLELRAALEHARLSSFLGELAPGTSVPFSSQTLARRAGYRECWDCWQDLTAGRRGVVADIDHAVANRDIAKLYELWCFFALADRLAERLGRPLRYRDLADDRVGVRDRATADFPGGWTLIYNRGYRRPSSYSIGLRPDFTLCRSSERLVAFDAKFRFEESLLEDGDDDEASPQPTERIAARGDLYKMHTYRDALRLRSAVVLFPGDQDHFFDASASPEAARAPLRETPIADLVDGVISGVGAIALRP